MMKAVFKRLKPGTENPEGYLRTHLQFLKMESIFYNSTGMRKVRVPKLQEDEQELKEAERKERKKFEEQIAKEKSATEKVL